MPQQWGSEMSTPFQPERDNFDLWISQVLMADVQNTEPSEQVWQRITRAVRASQAWEMWLERWAGSRYFSAWSICWEQRQSVDAMHLARIGWWLFNIKPVAYA
jgi:hypothetical protein